MVDAFGYDARSVREIRDELTKIIDNFPRLADDPLWVDAGPPVFQSVRLVGVTPGPRGRDMVGAKVMIRLHR